MIARRWKLRSLLRNLKRMSHEYQLKIRETDNRISDLKKKGQLLASRYQWIRADAITLDFDTTHNIGLTYKNRPLIRTVGGFFVVAITSWLLLELVQYLGLLHGTLSEPVARLSVTIAASIAATLAISYRYDYLRCQLCGDEKWSWSSPLCSRCRRDLCLDEIEQETISRIRAKWHEKQDSMRKMAAEGTTRLCAYCNGKLEWDNGWQEHICSVHGNPDMQFLYWRRDRLVNFRDYLQSDIKILEKELGIGG